MVNANHKASRSHHKPAGYAQLPRALLPAETQVQNGRVLRIGKPHCLRAYRSSGLSILLFRL
ncbi:MAG TPA: hypothetical protein DEP35_21480 [Deltaproteobacteria bacterium]|nr:hypothetical protein [Deltaproteobacteria bacterium]